MTMPDLTLERIDTLRLARSEGIGPVNFRRLLAEYGGGTRAVAELPERLRRAGRSKPAYVPTREEIEAELEATRRLGGEIVLLGDSRYPAMLSHLPDAPPMLSVLGDTRLFSRRAVGIVGARNASAAGIRMSETLSAGLAAVDIVVVSGLARGIDAAAHRAALYPGLTVAAVAGGLDQIYPPEHKNLQAEIAQKGCIVTEAPLGTVPQSRHFPRRNRLIAGLSLGCVVVEAALRSGTLITAHMTRDYGRELFAVPGSPLDPRSRGGNNLLRQGATLTESSEDILAELPETILAPAPLPWAGNSGFSEASTPWGNEVDDLPKAMREMRSLLSPTPIAVDDIVRRCQFSVSMAISALSELELGGFVSFLPGGQVVLLPEALI
ncbi:DNA-processing protein DprA [Kozakia baliensis]|uniref:DNA-processing protein DprA n=1 Tax=Kozakia baliensis TaxID=153496 RepID=UPI001268557C|nr:DNA-processing protein DprA [Kozakia baliensis]